MDAILWFILANLGIVAILGGSYAVLAKTDTNLAVSRRFWIPFVFFAANTIMIFRFFGPRWWDFLSLLFFAEIGWMGFKYISKKVKRIIMRRIRRKKRYDLARLLAKRQDGAA